MSRALRPRQRYAPTSPIGDCSARGAVRTAIARYPPAPPPSRASSLSSPSVDSCQPNRAAPSGDGRLAAIVFAHRAADLEPPTTQPDAGRLEKAMRGIRKDKKGELPGKKRAADGDVLRDMLRSITGEDLRAYRDRALLAVGMAGAFRRSELVAVTIARVSEDSRGLLVRIPSSKTDQEGQGHTVAIPDGRRLEPVQHYRAWLEKAKIGDGPVFRKLTPQGRLTDKPMSAQGVALVVKAAAIAAGYPPELFSGHSLRAGFLTEAGRQNANLFKMKEHSRHASLEMVAEYVRDHERFREHAGEGFL